MGLLRESCQDAGAARAAWRRVTGSAPPSWNRSRGRLFMAPSIRRSRVRVASAAVALAVAAPLLATTASGVLTAPLNKILHGPTPIAKSGDAPRTLTLLSDR